MGSPFEAYKNATLVFETENYTGNSFDNVGNPITVVEELTIECLLVPSMSRTQQEIKLQEGLDYNEILMEGYLVNPRNLPESIRAPALAKATIKTGIGRTETGIFTLDPVIQDPFLVALNIDFVNKISGLFRRS